MSNDPTYVSREDADRAHDQYEFACRVAGEVAAHPGETAATIRTRGTSRDQCAECGLDKVLWFGARECPRCGDTI